MHHALYIILVAAPFGALDVLYFHLWKFRLYERPQSRWEEMTHLVRGLVAPAIVALLVVGRPEGGMFWLVAALFLVDTINSLIDVVVEPGSRAPLGVPQEELAVHFIGTTAMGGAWAVYMITGWPARLLPTALATWNGAIPRWLARGVAPGICASFLLFAFEALLFFRAAGRR